MGQSEEFSAPDKNDPSPDDSGNPSVDFHGEKRGNETHESSTDPDALLAGKEAKLSYCGNLLTENRNGLIVNAALFPANGLAERAAAMAMLAQIPGGHPVTVGADKGYDTRDFVRECRHLRVTPHVAQNTRRAGGSAIDDRTTRHGGYAVSQKKRKRIEEMLWMAEDHRFAEEGAASGDGESPLDLYLRHGGLQSGADAEPAGSAGSDGMNGGVCPGFGDAGENEPPRRALNLL